MSSLASLSEVAEEMDTLDSIASGDICAGCHTAEVEVAFREAFGIWLCDSCHKEAAQ